MNRETLERLMLDDSLGALAEDIRSLLIERVTVAGSPAAARFAAYRRTVRGARAALKHARREALPPFPAERLRGEALRLRRRRRVGRIAALAASLVLGLGLGYLAFGRAEAPVPLPAPAPAVVAVAQTAPSNPEPFPEQPAPAPAVITDFWSSRGLAARAMAAQPQTPVKVTWVSPVQQPRIGG
ncbi:MAG: hypothetical protein IMZ44_05015 [Planctomycetes bacterium]|nr:hypothetical protein [Planctomycetota bacterium]